MYSFFKHQKNGDVIETIFTLPYLITYLLMFLNIARAQNPTFSWKGSSPGYWDGRPATWPVDYCLDVNIAYNNAPVNMSTPLSGELIFKNSYRIPDCTLGTHNYGLQLSYSPCFQGFGDILLISQLVCEGEFKIGLTLHTSLFQDNSPSYIIPCLVNSFSANGCQIEYMSFADQAKRKEEDILRTFGIVVGTAASALTLCGLVCCGPKICAQIKDRRLRANVADEHKKLADNFENDGLSGYGAVTKV